MASALEASYAVYYILVSAPHISVMGRCNRTIVSRHCYLRQRATTFTSVVKPSPHHRLNSCPPSEVAAQLPRGHPRFSMSCECLMKATPLYGAARRVHKGLEPNTWMQFYTMPAAAPEHWVVPAGHRPCMIEKHRGLCGSLCEQGDRPLQWHCLGLRTTCHHGHGHLCQETRT